MNAPRRSCFDRWHGSLPYYWSLVLGQQQSFLNETRSVIISPGTARETKKKSSKTPALPLLPVKNRAISIIYCAEPHGTRYRIGRNPAWPMWWMQSSSKETLRGEQIGSRSAFFFFSFWHFDYAIACGESLCGRNGASGPTRQPTTTTFLALPRLAMLSIVQMVRKFQKRTRNTKHNESLSSAPHFSLGCQQFDLFPAGEEELLRTQLLFKSDFPLENNVLTIFKSKTVYYPCSITRVARCCLQIDASRV